MDVRHPPFSYKKCNWAHAVIVQNTGIIEMKLTPFFLTGLFTVNLCAVSAAAAEPAAGKIAWFGTWQGGLAEARRTGRPILLVSGVPQCHNVPGVW
jgi:hypothetical protein